MRKAARTRQYIIEKTATLFNKKGYAGTSLADITKATGLTKGAVYGNFSGKDAVAAAVLEYNIDSLSEYIRKEVQKVTSAKDKLQVYINIYGQMFAHVLETGGCVYMNAAIDTDDMHPELFKKVKERFNRWHHTIQVLIAQGIERKEIRPEVDPVAFADMFIALIEGSILLSKTLQSDSHIKNNLKFLEHEIKTILIS